MPEPDSADMREQLADLGDSSLRHVPRAIVELDDLVSFLVRGKHEASLRLVRGASDEPRSYVEIAAHALQPAMYEVGRLWQEGKVSVAQEHLATGTAQFVLAEILGDQAFAEPTEKTAVIACVETNHHGLGVRMLGDAMMIAGWDVQVLGANTPTRDIVEHVGSVEPDVLGLSVSLPQQLELARKTIERVRAEMGSAAPVIMVGGLAVNQVEGIWKRFGADIWTPDVELAIAEIG